MLGVSVGLMLGVRRGSALPARGSDSWQCLQISMFELAGKKVLDLLHGAKQTLVIADRGKHAVEARHQLPSMLHGLHSRDASTSEEVTCTRDAGGWRDHPVCIQHRAGMAHIAMSYNCQCS